MQRKGNANPSFDFGGIIMKNILLGAVAVVAIAAAVVFACSMGGPPDVKVLSATEKAACGLSVEVTEGPYYVSGTAALQDGNLNATNLAGTPITISGHVYSGAEGTTPVANAKIEIWHADSTGNYHPNANGDVAKYKPAGLALRGFITTDAQGAYRFDTIYPGEYTGRTRHIHFKISNGAKTLTTQLILAVPGDKIGFDEDTIAKGLPSCALLKFDTSAKPETASFDFRL